MYKLLRKKQAVRDIADYLDTARSMDDRSLADTLAIAMQLRRSLLALGKGDLMIPWDAVAGNPTLPMELDQAIGHWRSQGDLFSMTRASGALLWLHSLRAVNCAQAHVKARELWGEFARGFPLLTEPAAFPRGLNPWSLEEGHPQVRVPAPASDKAASRRFLRPPAWIAAPFEPIRGL